MKEIDSKRGCLALKPKNISFEEATVAAYGGLLAFQQMEKGNIAPGHKVLIYGASGTTGTIAVQYAKHLGAAVTGVCGSSHVEFVRSLGADKVLDYTKNESIDYLEAYDFVLDAVGKNKTSALKKACAMALTANSGYFSIDDTPCCCNPTALSRPGNWSVGSDQAGERQDYRFTRIVEAHCYVETGHKKGNVAITVNTKN